MSLSATQTLDFCLILCYNSPHMNNEKGKNMAVKGIKSFKLTKQQIDLFFRSVMNWRDLLGLGDWEIDFETNTQPVPEGYGPQAILQEGYCRYDVESRRATIAVRVNLPYPRNDKDIKKLAFHEVFHLMLGDLNDMVMNNRVYDEDDADKECHRIIARMTNFLWLKSETK